MSSVYGDAHVPPGPGGVVGEVSADSAGERAGVTAGDVVVAVDGSPVRDLIDWMWQTADTPVTLTLLRDGAFRDVELHRAYDQETGIAFTDVVFDGVRTCDNACLFCFIAQLPAGLRPSLYVRDDDYRLSFLCGNFVSLTNLTDADVTRIVEQRLSPLHVSLHAADPDVRASLVCATVEDRTVERIDELLAEDIQLHVQIVLVPGVNDGDVLRETLAWLSERGGISSVGIVPLGFTRAQARFSSSYGDPADAASVLDALEVWREAKVCERDERWVYAADELYLAAGREVPPWDAYDGFPQFENGIGMLRAFLDEFDQAVAVADGAPATGARRPVTLLTGELFAPVLTSLAPRLARLGVEADVLAVPNGFLGGNVSVAGLLTGADLLPALAAAPEGRVYLLPDVVVNSDGLLLDGVPAHELGARSGRDVRIVPSDAVGLVSAVERIGTP